MGCIYNFAKRKKCSPDFVLPSYMGFYTGQGEKATDSSGKQAKIVAFTYAMVQLQLHKIFNVHLQFQCCI